MAARNAAINRECPRSPSMWMHRLATLITDEVKLLALGASAVAIDTLAKSVLPLSPSKPSQHPKVC